MKKERDSTSKFLSFILRHQPDAIGLPLDQEGWADVSDLISLATQHGREITLELIKEVVATSDKKRFALNDDLTKIRASQGHSIAIELGLAPVTPPAVLYHGTATRFLESIKSKGLIAGSRQHVHLSADLETAIAVGRRHGTPVVLIVESLRMNQSGHEFFISENRVWLTRSVPAAFIGFDNSRSLLEASP